MGGSVVHTGVSSMEGCFNSAWRCQRRTCQAGIPRLVPAVRSRTGEKSASCLTNFHAVATSPSQSALSLVLLLLFRQCTDVLVNLRAQLTAVDAAVVEGKHALLHLARSRTERRLHKAA